MKIHDFDIDETRINEDGETEYRIEGDDDWYTRDGLNELQSENEYWEEWARDLDRQDEDPNY